MGLFLVKVKRQGGGGSWSLWWVAAKEKKLWRIIINNYRINKSKQNLLFNKFLEYLFFFVLFTTKTKLKSPERKIESKKEAHYLPKDHYSILFDCLPFIELRISPQLSLSVHGFEVGRGEVSVPR